MRPKFYHSVSQRYPITGSRLLEHSTSRRPEVFYKKVVFHNFAEFTVKQLGRSLYLSKLKVEGLKHLFRKDFGTDLFL